MCTAVGSAARRSTYIVSPRLGNTRKTARIKVTIISNGVMAFLRFRVRARWIWVARSWSSVPPRQGGAADIRDRTDQSGKPGCADSSEAEAEQRTLALYRARIPVAGFRGVV